MRRKDKEIRDPSELEAIINNALVCRLAMSDENGPYMVPLCFGFTGKALFFHSAAHGKKLDILRKNPRVCFEFETDCALIKGEKGCEFSMRYRSVIGTGTAAIIEEPEAKQDAMDVIMAQYVDGKFVYSEAALKKIVIIKVEIDTMTAKASPPNEI